MQSMFRSHAKSTHMMKDYFAHVSREFLERSVQIRRLLTSHAPSIGSGHEVLLRSFLRQYLPKWMAVGQGFIRSHTGQVSGQIDILIYNSAYYAPLYTIDDFVIVHPEAVVACVEVKTSVTETELAKAIRRLAAIKDFDTSILCTVFIFHPSKLFALRKHLQRFDASNIAHGTLPDWFFGMGEFAIRKVDLLRPGGGSGVGYLNLTFEPAREGRDFIFETFYYEVYRAVEARINMDLKKGIDNVWEIKDDAAYPRGRLRFSEAKQYLGQPVVIIGDTHPKDGSVPSLMLRHKRKSDGRNTAEVTQKTTSDTPL